MDLELQQTPGGLRISGEMTVYSAAALKPALLHELAVERGALELDLSQVGEFDTAGLQLLLLLSRECESAHRKLRIVGCSDVVRAALQLCCKESLLDTTAGAGTEAS